MPTSTGSDNYVGIIEIYTAMRSYLQFCTHPCIVVTACHKPHVNYALLSWHLLYAKRQDCKHHRFLLFSSSTSPLPMILIISPSVSYLQSQFCMLFPSFPHVERQASTHPPSPRYDCFIPPDRSTPISGKAPNGTKRCKGVEKKPCQSAAALDGRWENDGK